ncbi:MAG: RNA polymerase sigma factor [Clostridiaceae bacterium]|nr:RNA polymerase sigma factor [Clostridiaceae bacterium]
MIDPEIIKRCQQEDQDAYDDLYRAAGKKALWTVYMLTGKMNTAEDIVQEAFFQCFRNIKKLQKPELFPVWFNRILLRTCWHMVYKEKKGSAVSLEAESLSDLKSDENVLEKVESDHISSVIREAVNRLKPSMRSTVVLYYYNELTIREIAQVMGCFQGTVKSRLHYAKKVLEKELKKEISEEYIRMSGNPGCTGKECTANE